LARQLRHRPTDAERKLWQALRGRQISGEKFRRQYPIGPYVADFCCTKLRLIVELDGSQHMDQIVKDEARTMYLIAHGYRVMRFWDNDVLTNLEGVLERIAGATAHSP
jgi:very-short-patch-repair endonuclease